MTGLVMLPCPDCRCQMPHRWVIEHNLNACVYCGHQHTPPVTRNVTRWNHGGGPELRGVATRKKRKGRMRDSLEQAMGSLES
jgi:hypothetical protein